MGRIKNLDVNPCKMCMPLGAVTALSGIKNCMTILHGSQGCATYIRRHMATHYNEPVDVASSSLTEEGTVFGGRENLVRGLENLFSLYGPEVIGVATTCLAETIGEDIPAIVKEFCSEHPGVGAKVISVSTPGYGGTQSEGFFRALCALVSQVEMDPTPNGCINVIAPMLSPADYRLLREMLDATGIRYILLPDLSDNLDSGYYRKYMRLKGGGTSLEEISKMAGAAHTVELSLFEGDEYSPARRLFEMYSVPYTRMAMPVGVRGTDEFVKKLVSLGGACAPRLTKERGRYIDAMVDSHKHCAKGRAAIFGDPDFVYAIARLCCECGVVPVLAATGAVCPQLKEKLGEEVRSCGERLFVEETLVLDDCDFETIEAEAERLGVNVMIGSSDGRRVSRRLGIGLVRCAFPIHDRVGGQRIRTLGYEGAINVLEMVANSLLAAEEECYRDLPRAKYLGKSATAPKGEEGRAPGAIRGADERTKSHPCFSRSAGSYARMHLPVAADCNVQCNYCVRKYDCPNESRPGVTSRVLSPEEALERYKEARLRIQSLSVVGIAGPGDALASFAMTRRTLELIRKFDPDVTFCLATNGLMLPFYAQELLDLGVTHFTITINAVDPEIGAKIYSHVEYMGRRYTGVAGASVLLANQLAGLSYVAGRGAVCKINTVVLRGINDRHVGDIAAVVKRLGARVSNMMPHVPVQGSAFERLQPLGGPEIEAARKMCAETILQMRHCRQCRADAVGLLGEDEPNVFACRGEVSGPDYRYDAVLPGAVLPVQGADKAALRAFV